MPPRPAAPADNDDSYGVEDSANNSSADIQWRALTAVVADVSPMLDVHDELGDVAAAEAAVIAKDTERGAIVDRLHDELRVLAAQHHAAADAAQRPKGTPSAAEHEAAVRSLEHQQYSAGKQLNEEQGNVAKREVELGRVKAERDEVRRWDVAAGAGNDGQVIRLQLFAGMGFKLASESPVKFIVRNDAKPDVHTVTPPQTADPAQRVHYANRLWDLAGE